MQSYIKRQQHVRIQIVLQYLTRFNVSNKFLNLQTFVCIDLTVSRAEMEALQKNCVLRKQVLLSM